MDSDEEAGKRSVRQQGYWFVAVSFTAAVVFALVSYLVATFLLEVDLSFPATTITAVIIGVFVSLIMARPRSRWVEFMQGQSRAATRKDLATTLDPEEIDEAPADEPGPSGKLKEEE